MIRFRPQWPLRCAGKPGAPRTRRFGAALLFLASCMPWAVQAHTSEEVVPGTMAARVAACTHCHGADGQAGPDGFYPRIAGKPAGYLYAQLLHFRDGTRNYEPMRYLLQGLGNQYLFDIAQYFADLRLPHAPPARTTAPQALLEQGRSLAINGDTARGVPACAACHGNAFTGMQPHIPGLLGLSRDYLAAQLGAWRTGLRKATAPDCMAKVVEQLTPHDIAAVSAWLAAQPVPEPYVAAPANSFSLPIECGVTPLPGTRQP